MVVEEGRVEGPFTNEGRLLLALLNNDFDFADEITDLIEGDALNRLFDAALLIVVKRYFVPDTPVHEIAKFIDKMALVAAKEGAVVGKRVAEAVIRVSLGEHDLLNGVEPDDVVEAVIAVLGYGCALDGDDCAALALSIAAESAMGPQS